MPPLRVLESAALGRVLPLLLTEPGALAPANAGQVRAFMAHAAAAGLRCMGCMVEHGSTIRAAFAALLAPGGTALVFTAPPDAPGVDRAAQLDVVHAGLAALAPFGLHFVQALLDPSDAARSELLTACGFSRLTTLEYYERQAVFPWAAPATVGGVEWRCYDAASHGEFAAAVAESYIGSSDCPELSGIRPIDDVLAGHRASGVFRPHLWQLARIDGAAAGVVLISELDGGRAIEIAYLGVSPHHRRRGLGSLLVRRAIELARGGRAAMLHVAADGRNAAARRTYERACFTRSATRAVYVWFGGPRGGRGVESPE